MPSIFPRPLQDPSQVIPALALFVSSQFLTRIPRWFLRLIYDSMLEKPKRMYWEQEAMLAFRICVSFPLSVSILCWFYWGRGGRSRNGLPISEIASFSPFPLFIPRWIWLAIELSFLFLVTRKSRGENKEWGETVPKVSTFGFSFCRANANAHARTRAVCIPPCHKRHFSLLQTISG